MRSTNGQAWGFDLMIALAVFSGALILFYLYSLNAPNQTNDILEQLFYEGDLVSENLLTAGYPENWTNATVVRIGISNSGAINETKLAQLYNMTNTSAGYTLSKSLFNVENEYFFNFSVPLVIEGNTVGGIGRYSSDPKNLIKVSRFTVLDGEPVTLHVLLWNT